MRSPQPAAAYEATRPDPVRGELEEGFFGRLLPRLLASAPGRELLDLGCGDGLVARLGGARLSRYVGLDLRPPAALERAVIPHDLRDGLGPVGPRPFDVYLGTFGIASHLAPEELRRLLRETASHARPGAVVALEALGLYSLEWPRLWSVPAGAAARSIPYRLAAEVTVHPWSAAELGSLFESCGIAPLWTVDRSLQAGPKCGPGRYWPGLPPLREALAWLLAGAPSAPARKALAAPLPPLPAGDAALVHHTLAARRRELVRRRSPNGPALARAVWALEPPTGGGYGHGVLVVGRVR